MGYRIGIDVGGTFTDFVYLDSPDNMKVFKVPSTAEDQSLGVISGLKKIAEAEGYGLEQLLEMTDLIVHGTTVATNTMLEFNGAKTGLITTRGFRDDIELRRGYKERIFNPRFPAPTPIAFRRNRLTVAERIDKNGNVHTALDESEARDAVMKLKDAGVESIGVCLLFSFLNPEHEKRIAGIINEVYPDAYISLSHEVLPQIREFERVSTTLVNSYTHPKLSKYLNRLESELRQLGFRNEFYVMLSGGGIMNVDYAGKYPVFSLLSGPAGGIVAATQLIGGDPAYSNLITIDMGGTSFDVSLIKNNQPAVSSDNWFSRYRIAIPMLDIHTIGSGGGSIAWVDAGGALQVGPRSAGSDPGPVCYGRGGTEPTVTDANLILGYLDPDTFLGGEMRLDLSAAEKSVDKLVAKPLGMDTIEAAHGIYRIVNNNMANGIRTVSIQRGHDPREFTLVAFGGNGPVHAGILAEELEIGTIIVSRLATALSARGMLSSNIVVNKMRTYIGTSEKYNLDEINSLFTAMKKEVEADMPAAGRSVAASIQEVEHNYFVDAHYHGELHEITVPLHHEEGRVTDQGIREAAEAFHQSHETLHTFANRDQPVFFMNLRLKSVRPMETIPLPEKELSDSNPESALRSNRNVFFEQVGGFVETPIFDGNRIKSGYILPGPCIIEEAATNIVVCPDQVARLTAADFYEITCSK